MFWVAFGFIVAFVSYAIIFKDRAAETLQGGANWLLENFNWLYIGSISLA
ncbi:BCCT family transporter, partial [uncultured Corynebacterium sp.]